MRSVDAADRLKTEQGRDGIVAYEWDELDSLAALKLPHEQRIDYLVYGSGHVHQVRCGEQVIADIERDELHREVLRTQGRLNQGLGYDALGRRTWQSAAAKRTALAPGQGQLWRTYRYSAEGELAEQRDGTRGAWQYRYDPAGQMLARSRPDGRGGLERFAWDAAGNLLDATEGASAGRGNRLTMWQDIRLGYDAWGNLGTKRSGSRQVQRFVFDDENRLLAVKTESGRGSNETRFEYDALGRRIGRIELRVGPGGRREGPAIERRFVWQGLRMVQELRETGLSNYVYSPDDDYAPMARVDASIVQAAAAAAAASADAAIANAQQAARSGLRTLHFHTDSVGAPLEVTTQEGELAWQGDYSAWGRVEYSPQQALDNRIEQPLRYAGQYADDSTGLHYNTFRYYDPEVGRFISQDPIGIDGGMNLYAYVPNPTGWTDPLGWMPWPWSAGGWGHHLIPRGKASSIGLSELATPTRTPTFFPDPYVPGMHEELHRAIRGDTGKLQGAWTGSAEELFEATSKNLDSVAHIRGDLRIPATGEVLAHNVTPKEAHSKLVNWYRQQRNGHGGGGGCL